MLVNDARVLGTSWPDCRRRAGTRAGSAVPFQDIGCLSATVRGGDAVSATEAGPYDLRSPRRELSCRRERGTCHITAPRPMTGRSSTSVRCDSCKELVGCTIYSVRQARKLRAWSYLYAVAVLACAGSVFFGCVLLSDRTEPGQESSFLEGFGVLALLVAFGLTYCAGLLFVRAWSEDGIRLTSGKRTHSLFRPPAAELGPPATGTASRCNHGSADASPCETP